jgi:deazaflavin-dependent oxidoreductase (nitroreductase family)
VWYQRHDPVIATGELHMDERVQHALEHDSLIDITTRGRKTGQRHRIEIRFHNLEGDLYLTGRPPRPRDWYANLLAHPEFTFHLKQSVRADLPARATPMLDQDARRAILAAIHQELGRYQDIEAWIESSPLVAVELLVD